MYPSSSIQKCCNLLACYRPYHQNSEPAAGIRSAARTASPILRASIIAKKSKVFQIRDPIKCQSHRPPIPGQKSIVQILDT